MENTVELFRWKKPKDLDPTNEKIEEFINTV